MTQIFLLASNLHYLRSRMRNITALLLVTLWYPILWAGTPTLKTITIDGDPADWSEVLANPLQVTQDGDGSSMDPSQCDTLSNDRDCPVGTVGRDLGTFAWTFDNTYIYIYQTRLGSSSNRQDFWFYMDVGQDQLMNSGDYVLHVVYKGSNRSTEVELYGYVEATPGGDPMVDADGYADGYTMPGSLGTYLGYYGDLHGGFSDGSGFETRVPWSDLGVSAGTGVYFHVGSSNGTNLPDQIDDNCGGPDGGIGTFGFYLLSISPNHQGSTQPGTTVSYAHQAENTGTFDATLDLKVTSTSGFSLSLYDPSTSQYFATDTNGDGDFSDTGDYLDPAYDTNGNGFPDTGILAPDGIFSFQIEITIPAGTAFGTDTTTIYGWIEGEDADDTAVDTTAIGDIQVKWDQSKAGTPGLEVPFGFTVIHYLLSDTITLKAFSSSGWGINFYTDPEGDGVGNSLMGTDANGDGDFSDTGDYLDPAYDTNGDGFLDTGLLDPNTVYPFVVSLTIPSGTPYDTQDTLMVYGITSSINNGVQDSATGVLTVKPRLSISPDYLTSEGNNYYGAAGLSLYFPHEVVNAFSTQDVGLLSYSATDGATVQFWSDPNCDGSISDGSIITDTGTLEPNGGKACIVAEAQIPSSVAKGTTVVIQITVTSQSDPAYSDTATDEVLISYLVPYEDSIYSKSQSHFAHCQTVYIKGYNFWPFQTYYLHYVDPGLVEKKTATMVANGFGQYSDDYTFGSNDIKGSWSISSDDGSTTWDTITITLEPDGNVNTISPFKTQRMRYNLADSITLEATLNNTNLGGYYKNSLLKELLVSNDSTLYWDGSAFQSYTGSEWSRISSPMDVLASSSVNDTFTFPNVSFPYPGVWRIEGQWEGSCGYLVSQSSFSFLVGTTLGTYSDATYSTPQSTFWLHDPVYLAGDYYFPNTDVKVAYYDGAGNLIATTPTTTDGSGKVTLTQDTSTWTTEGTVYAVVYLASSTPSPIYDADDPNLLGSTSFVLERLPGLLRNDQYEVEGRNIFIQSYPDDPALDPVNDLEKVDFRSADSFPHEVNDLDPTAPTLIFYELDKATDTLRVVKSAGKIVITY